MGSGPSTAGRDWSGARSRRTLLRGGGVALAAGLAGCSGGGQQSPTGTTTGRGTNAGPQTITFLPSWITYYGDTYREMVRAFNDRHDATVEFAYDLELQSDVRETRTYRTTMQLVFEAAQSGTQPDVANLGQIATVRAMDQGIFDPVGPVLGDRFDEDEYFRQATAPYRVNGRLWTIPFSASNIVMLYNREMFAEAGLDPQNPPTTFSAFREAMETIVDEGVAEYGCTWPNAAWWPISWFGEAGELLYDERNGHSGSPSRTYLQSETGRRIYEWWAGLGRDGLYYNPGIEAWGPADDAFLNGRAAVGMTSSGSMVFRLAEARDPDTGAGAMDVGIASLVRPDGGRRYGHAPGGSSLWVRSGLSGARRDAVAQFLLFLTSAQEQARWHRATGYLPSNAGALSVLESAGWFDANPELRTALDQFQAWQNTPATRGTTLGPAPQVRSRLARAADTMVRGNTPVEEALAAADRDITTLLTNYQRRI